jgi:hypothetical protein
MKALPALVVIALGLCVKHTIEANARADAARRAAQAATQYATQQEKERQMHDQAAKDTIAKLQRQIASRAVSRTQDLVDAHETEAKLRAQLTKDQRVQLDSMARHYERVIVSLNQDKSDMAAIILQRDKQLAEADASVRNLEAANAAIRAQIAAQPRDHSTAWKIATGVATVAGVVAYVSKH